MPDEDKAQPEPPKPESTPDSDAADSESDFDSIINPKKKHYSFGSREKPKTKENHEIKEGGDK